MPTKIVNEPLGYHLAGTAVNVLASQKPSGAPLPSDLIIAPGTYRVFNRAWSCQREGVYRFLLPGKINHQRIVYKKDPWILLSSISWLASHGSRDDQKPIRHWLRLALHEKLVITCGNVARLGQEVLTRFGITSRLVGAKTLGKLNDYDTGHSLLEVHVGGKWVLVDLDAKTLFRRNGRRLNLLEFVAAAAADDYEFEPLSKATGIAVAAFVENGYDYGLFMETVFTTEANLRGWYHRIMGIPIIHEGDKHYVTTANAAQRRKAMQNYTYFTHLDRPEFIRRFYNGSRG
jgi:hypothetical protein